MEMKYCRRCGSELKREKRHIYTCANGHTIFANRSPAVGLFLITKDQQVVLSVRGIEPRKGMFDAFGGFLDENETFEEAVARELREELGLEPVDYSDPIYLTSGIGSYPYEGEALPIISTLYYAYLNDGAKMKPSDDVQDIVILPLESIPFDKLHDQDIQAGIAKLKEVLAV